MTKSFNKVLELIQKTGDRCIILPEGGDDVYVVMSLPEYERLALRKNEVASLTEDELLDKINRDIAVWKSQQEEEKEENQEQEDDWLSKKEEDWDEWDDEDEEIEEDPYYFENIDR